MFNIGLSPLAQAARRAVSAVTFLFRDDFTTNESAPLASPRTAEPGPGTATIVDSGNKLSIVSQRFQRTAGGVSSWTDPRYYGDGLSRSSGLCLHCLFRVDSALANDLIGFRSVVTGGSSNIVFGYLFNGSTRRGWALPAAPIFSTSSPTGTDSKLFFITRSLGGFLIFNDSLEWVFDSGSDATLYPSWQIESGAARTTLVDNFRVSQLPAPWNTDYGIATDRLAGARTAGNTFTHEADALIEFEEGTIPSSGQTEFAFRMQDASNYWQVTIDSSGDIDLDEVVAGSPTQRGTSAGVIANSDRIMIICDDETIRVYEANALRITYSSAANFKTATAGKLIDEGTGGAVSDIISWPRTLSGTAKDALDAVANA